VLTALSALGRFVSLFEKIARKYGLTAPVTKSNIAQGPDLLNGWRPLVRVLRGRLFVASNKEGMKLWVR
jgi:hypothetical protein